jgi:hypothetical protein
VVRWKKKEEEGGAVMEGMEGCFLVRFCGRTRMRFLHQHPDFGGVKPLRVTALRASLCFLQQSP